MLQGSSRGGIQMDEGPTGGASSHINASVNLNAHPDTPCSPEVAHLFFSSHSMLSDPSQLALRLGVLRKSEFYETLLSERWSAADKLPTEIHITSPHCNEYYIKCIQLMYSSQQGKNFCFSSVDEVQAILPVASEILFQQCLEECMRYLNAVRWSTKQEVRLRALLLSLEINILPDLATRLGITQWNS